MKLGKYHKNMKMNLKTSNKYQMKKEKSFTTLRIS